MKYMAKVCVNFVENYILDH